MMVQVLKVNEGCDTLCANILNYGHYYHIGNYFSPASQHFIHAVDQIYFAGGVVTLHQ
jgi:hypothetical protein